MTGSHHEVDGVEIPRAAEATCEIGFWVRGRIELTAQRAEEAEVPLGDFRRHVEDVGDQVRDGDFVAQGFYDVRRVTLCHGGRCGLRQVEVCHGVVNEGLGDLLEVL